MGSNENKIAQISLFLSQKGIVPVAWKEKNDINYQAKNIKHEDILCRFVYFETRSEKNNPPWLEFIDQKSKNNINFSTSYFNPNGLLYIPFEDRTLVAAFGRSAESKLDKSLLEHDFGIITAMNMCGNENLRQTKTVNTSLAVTHTSRQISQPSDSFTFGLEDSDEIKFISAQLPETSQVTLQGKDRLTYKGIGEKKLTWEGLIKLAESLKKAYEKDDYKELFPNYLNFSSASKTEAEKLDQLLIKVINSTNLDKIELSIPEFISDDEYGFVYGSKENFTHHSFLETSQLKTELKLPIDKVVTLKNKKIYAYSFEENSVLQYKNWPLYKCIIFETKLDDDHYILSDGKWRKIDRDFYNDVNSKVQSIQLEDCPENTTNILVYDDSSGTNREELFIKKACEKNPSWIKFDQAKLKIGAGKKNKEFCDILAMLDNKKVDIIHCKPKSGNSSLNYLFAQAKFYGEAFLRDEVFFEEVKAHIENSKSAVKQSYLDKIGADFSKLVAQNFKIRLWILYDKKQNQPNIKSLSFMSQYELMLADLHLRKICKFSEVIVSFVPVERVRASFTKSKKPK